MAVFGALHFVALLGWALGLMALLPRLRAGGALFSAACGMLFVSWYGVIVLGAMTPTAWLLMGGGLLCLPAAMLCAALRGRRAFWRRLMSPGLEVYVVACILCMCLCHGAATHGHDELSYWARAPKELYTFNTFYRHADSTMFHMDYIPLLASLQYCVVRVFGWQEPSLIYVVFGLIASGAALLAELPSRRWLGYVLGVLAFFGVGAFGFDWMDLRADVSMQMVFVAALMSFLWRDTDDVTALLPAVSAAAVLTGFKIYSGLMYALVLALAMLAAWLGARKRGRKPPAPEAAGAGSAARTRALGVATLLAFALPLLLQVSWMLTFNLAEARAVADAAALNAAYAGRVTEAAPGAVSLGNLFSGNDRTGRFFSALGGDLSRVGGMIAATCADYTASPQPMMWQFWMLVAVLLPAVRSTVVRRRCGQSLGWLLLAGVVYLLGLFASYLVQAETSGAAANYLLTATTPLLIGALTCAVMMADAWPLAGGIAYVAVLAAALLLLPPNTLSLFQRDTEENPAIELAATLLEDDLDGLLTEEDAGKRALIIDCSYAASEIRSPSNKTHAYGYVALPVRAVVTQYPWGDYSELDGVTRKALCGTLLANRVELLMLNIDDELYWDAIRGALELEEDAEPIGLYDVTYQDGEFAFELRWD